MWRPDYPTGAHDGLGPKKGNERTALISLSLGGAGDHHALCPAPGRYDGGGHGGAGTLYPTQGMMMTVRRFHLLKLPMKCYHS